MTSEPGRGAPRRNRIAEFRRLVGGGYQVRLQHQVVYFEGVAALIWRNLDGKHDLPSLARIVASEYDVALDQAASDIEEFLSDLGTRGFLEDG